MSAEPTSPPPSAVADEPVEKWWFIVWTVWGAVVGLLIVWLDRAPLVGAAWLVAGALAGPASRKLWRPLAGPFDDWYCRISGASEYSERILQRMVRGDAESEAFHRLCEEEAHCRILSTMPLVGLFHGVLLGAPVGGLAPLAPDMNLSATQGALLGLVIGPLVCAFVEAATFALLVRSRERPLAYGVLALSAPILVLPALGSAIWTIIRRRGASG